MTRRVRFVAAAVLALSALGFSCARTKPGVAQFEQRLDRAVPVGIPLGQVLVALDSMGMPHAEYDPQARTVRARLAEPADQVVSRTFQVTFHFDASQKLVSREVRERFTGP